MPDSRTNHVETIESDAQEADGQEGSAPERADPTTPEGSRAADGDAGMPAAGQMAVLRDLIFGEQQRSFDGRLEELEGVLNATRDEIVARLERDVSALAERSAGRLDEVSRDLTMQIETQGADQQQSLSAATESLTSEFQRRDEGQTARLGAFQEEVVERLEQLSSHFAEQLNASRTEFTAALTVLTETLDARLADMEGDGEARDELLREEFLSLAESLDDRKTSRSDLGQMLMDLGARLRLETEVRDGR